jgi:hypothetical protein
MLVLPLLWRALFLGFMTKSRVGGRETGLRGPASRAAMKDHAVRGAGGGGYLLGFPGNFLLLLSDHNPFLDGGHPVGQQLCLFLMQLVNLV